MYSRLNAGYTKYFGLVLYVLEMHSVWSSDFCFERDVCRQGANGKLEHQHSLQFQMLA